MADILDSDYNSTRAKVQQLLSTGSGSFGYGQSLNSSIVSQGNDITAAQWQALRSDIVNIILHQSGSIPSSLAEIKRGDLIQLLTLTRFNEILDDAISSRFNIGSNRLTIALGTSESRTGSWTLQSQCTVTVSFSNSNQARHFFNSGGKLRFTSSRTGGTSSAQNNAWTNILLAAGPYEFSGNNIQLNNFYSMIDTYKVIFIRQLSTPYSANFYQIEAKTNVANNATGSATVLDFRITWRDDYVDPLPGGGLSPSLFPPDDLVDGTLNILVEELKASGSILPSGNFTIASPTYSITSITAS
jgi:hypothetical protein